MRSMPAEHTGNKEHKMKRTSSAAASLIRPLAVAGIVMATITLMPLPAGGFFICAVQNRMGEEMYFERQELGWPVPTRFTVAPGETVKKEYVSVDSSFAEEIEGREYTGRVTSSWTTYAGNTMTGVVLWDETWPEAQLCLEGAWPGCTLVFENKEVTLLSGTGGRRLLGDLAVKECSKNWNGLGGWLPWGIGCTYPKHDHPYVGTVVS